MMSEINLEPLAFIFSRGVEKLETTECSVNAFSVAMGSPDDRTVPVYSQKQVEQLQQHNKALQARVGRLEAEHEDLVLRNALLRQRPDLPVERLQAYSQIQAEAVESSHEKKMSDILYRYIDRLKDPDPTHDPLDKIVAELIASFEAAHHD